MSVFPFSGLNLGAGNTFETPLHEKEKKRVLPLLAQAVMLKRINPVGRTGHLKMVPDPLSRWWKTGSTCCRTSLGTSLVAAWLCTAPLAWDGTWAEFIATQNVIFTEKTEESELYFLRGAKFAFYIGFYGLSTPAKLSMSLGDGHKLRSRIQTTKQSY